MPGAGTMTGYSGTPLARKLGLRPGLRTYARRLPPSVRRAVAAALEETTESRTLRGPLDWLHVFVTRQAVLEGEVGELKRAMDPAGQLWVSWPKKASGVATDVTEDVVRDVALAHGLVDVKVCAVDDTWSALKLVVRLRDRPGAKGPVRRP